MYVNLVKNDDYYVIDRFCRKEAVSIKEKKQIKFECDCCGLCCRKLDNNPIYKDLDRGDGTCKNLNLETMLCTIYDERPIICNVDGFYNQYLKHDVQYEDYVLMNIESCKKLKEENECI